MSGQSSKRATPNSDRIEHIDLSRLVPIAKLPIPEVPWLSQRTARHLVYSRKIPSYRAGGKVLISLDDVAAYVAHSRRDAVE